MVICSLIPVAPYYDCPPTYDGVLDDSGELWKINVYHNYYRGNIPTSSTIYDSSAKSGFDGYANWQTGTINVVEDGLTKTDSCNRTILQHELLHMKYKDAGLIHTTCIIW
ncbi:MAG: hypothetical protein ACE5RJ_02705 [Nitrosopumilaceae archaeon]